MNPTFSQLLNQTEQLQPLLKRLPIVLNFVLIIACAQLISELVWMLLDDSKTETMAVTAPLNAASNNNRNNAKQAQQQAFRNLSSAHLFGTAETLKSTNNNSGAPETKLNLLLKGVLAAGTSAIASAIIARSSNGKEEIYSIGDKIPGGITLKEIHPDHVILERQGQLETLRMLKSKGSDKISFGTKASSTPRISAASSRKLKNIRNDIIKSPASFRKYATPVVVRENGKQIGYRLQAKQNSDLMTQAGLKPSDVITSINGIKLNDMKNSISALNALRSANNVDVTVKRNGSEISLNIQLQ